MAEFKQIKTLIVDTDFKLMTMNTIKLNISRDKTFVGFAMP